MADKGEISLIAFLTGAFCLSVGYYLGSLNPTVTHNTYSITYPRPESNQEVIRLYLPGKDIILVETETAGEKKHESFQSYLKKFRDETKREQERASIEKLVGWDE